MVKNNLRLAFFSAVLLFFGCFPALLRSATLTAPERAEVGRLQTVQSDVKGDWLIYPPDGADLAKDSDEQRLYFVARKDGELTIIFFGVEDGKPVITQTAVMVGAEPAPSPLPDPTPDPVPVVTLSEREQAAAVGALNAVITGIDTGTIKTPAGARSTFKQVLMTKGQVCNGRQCYLPETLKKLTEDWTQRTDFSTLDAIKESFTEFLKEVE